jgi:hypothetical protein
MNLYSDVYLFIYFDEDAGVACCCGAAYRFLIFSKTSSQVING